jgi:hypothetical protein
MIGRALHTTATVAVLVVALASAPALASNSAAYQTSKTIETTCDAVWPVMLYAVTKNGFTPVLSDRAGGVLKAAFNGKESRYRGAERDMNALTLNQYSRWTLFERFHIQDVVITVAPSGNACSVSLHAQYAALRNNVLQKGWVALESNGRLEWMMLAEIDHLATGAGKPSHSQEKIGPEVRKDQTPPVAVPRENETPKGIVVRFTSIPSEAEVRVDGEYWGTTPTADLTRLSSGPHVIVVKKLGYQPWEQRITLTPGDDRTISAVLEAQQNDPTKPRIVGN